MAWYMLWPGEAWHGIWYGLAGMALEKVWPGGHGIVYGMARKWYMVKPGGMAWYMVWPGGHGMAYSKAWRA